MGRAVIVDLSEIDRVAKTMEEACAKMRTIIERAERGVPVCYTEENGVKPADVTAES